MKNLRIGMVGAGFISDWHHDAFASLPDVEFAALCHEPFGNEAQMAADRALLKKKCAEWGTVPYESFDAIAADPSLDALVIGTINPCHYRQIIAALKAGKHLLVEKPVVTDPKSLEEIRNLSESVGRVVFPGHNFVYRNAVRKAKEIIESGALGKLVYSSFISSHTISENHATGWRAKKELAMGGALMDSGHHLVYQMLYLLGMPVALQAFCAKQILTNMDGEDTASVHVQFADGSVGCIMQSWASGKDYDISGIRIMGDKASITISDALYLNGEKITDDVQYGDSFVREARAFVDCINNGSRPVSSLDDSRDALTFIYAAYDSCKSKSVICF
ncbi:MAG: Gfo/Idh/MocA family protein [Chthoniobacteraceae bacterium]